MHIQKSLVALLSSPCLSAVLRLLKGDQTSSSIQKNRLPFSFRMFFPSEDGEVAGFVYLSHL